MDWKKAIPELLGLLNDNDVLYFLEHLFINDLDLTYGTWDWASTFFLLNIIFLSVTCQVFYVLKKMYLSDLASKDSATFNCAKKRFNYQELISIVWGYFNSLTFELPSHKYGLVFEKDCHWLKEEFIFITKRCNCSEFVVSLDDRTDTIYPGCCVSTVNNDC